MDKNEINQLAHLARINIDEESASDVAESITRVLEFVAQLERADTDNISPMSHPLNAKQQLRADVVTEPNNKESLQAIAPAVEKGLFLVPKVID